MLKARPTKLASNTATSWTEHVPHFLTIVCVALGLGIFSGGALISPAHASTGCLEDDDKRQLRLERCVSDKLSAFTVTDCPDAICGVAGRVDALRSLAGLQAGAATTLPMLKLAILRLRQTGYFRDVVPHCSQASEGLEVGLKVCPNTFVRRVSIVGNRSLHKREIKKRIFLRSGTILNVDPGHPLSHKRVLNQAKSIRSLYLKEGLRLAPLDCGPAVDKKQCGIRFRVTQVSSTDIDIVIELEELERRRIRTIEARHIHPVATGSLQCPHVSSSDIAALMNVNTGDVVTKRKLKRMEQKLRQWFQSIGYVRPQVEVVPRGEPITLEASVRTEKCWIVRVWERPQSRAASDLLEPSFREPDPVQGHKAERGGRPYERATFEDWRGPLGFGNSGDFEIEEASRGVGAIHGILQGKGYLFADVSMEHRRIEDPQSKASVEGIIDYYITLNRQRRIQGMTFKGLTSFSKSQLRKLISTKSDDVTVTGFLSVARVFADLARLKTFYQDRGFYDFRFEWTGTPSDAMPTRRFHREDGFLVWTFRYRDRGFQIRKRSGENVVYLLLHAHEGRQAKLGAVQVTEGALKIDTSPLNLALHPGGAYGVSFLSQDLRTLEALYRKKGHYAVKVQAICDARHPEPLDVCDPKRVRSAEVDIFIKILPGPQVRVGEVFYRGNFRTEKSVLTRDFPTPGSPYVQTQIQEAARKLRNTGIFNSVRITPIGLDESPPPEEIALVVSVEESPSRFVDFAAGFRTIDRANLGRVPALFSSTMGHAVSAADRMTSGHTRSQLLTIPDVLLVTEAAYVDQSFLGRGQELKLPLEYGFSTTTPLRLLRTRPRWTIRRAFNTDATLEVLGRLIYADRVSEVKDFGEYSLGLRLTYPLMKSMALSAEVAGGVLRFEEPDTDDIIDPTLGLYEPFVRTTLRWRWDKTDNPLHPTKGFALSTALSYILDNELEGSRVISRDFVKWELSARMVQQIPPGIIIALFAHYGGSNGSEDFPLPTQERFTLGNSNGLRGFAEDAVGRYDAQGALLAPPEDSLLDYGGNVLLNGSVELRIPIVKAAGLWMSTFFDWGALAANHDEIHAQSFRFSAGLGLRYLLMNQIPIRLDWGAVLGDLRCQAYSADSLEKGSPQCETQENRSAVHFGFLYPF